jgi:tripartite ATP-independent transporter DctM subunit
MDWWIVMLLLFGGLVIFMLTGMPIAFAFIIFNFIGVFFLMGAGGFEQVVSSMVDSLARFTLVPVPMFILMGGIIFYSGIADRIINVVDDWLGKLPGRLSLLAVISGTIFAALTGSTMGSTAMLGTLLVPEMRSRGYANSMILGPIMGAGGLAMIIPPSALGVILGSLASMDIGRLLIGGVFPGILIAFLYALYIVVRAWLQPSLAPSYSVPPKALTTKVANVAKFLLPMVFIILAVLGSMFLGVATPTEAAALGAFAAFILAAAYGKLTWKATSNTFKSTVEITVMAFMIIAGSNVFSQIMAFSGVSRSLVQVATSAEISPILILITFQIILLFLGCFMEQVAMMMITLPIFMPVVTALHFDPIWFGIMMLINLEVGMLTPPFGMVLFVMKGVAPKDVTMGDVYRAAIPFVALDILAIALIMAFPQIATFLPGIMRY